MHKKIGLIIPKNPQSYEKLVKWHKIFLFTEAIGMTHHTLLKPHNLFTALFPIIVLVSLLATSVLVFKEDASSGTNQIALFIGTLVAIVMGIYRGQKYEQLEEGIVRGISSAIGACLILLFIGALIGVWLTSGTVATIIYYGVNIISVKWFYACTIITSALVALSIGSSWTTSGTIGVAFIGMAQTLGLDPVITAGAIISGAYLGDKLSPISETTNLAAAVAETNLFGHIKNMLWTTVPSFIIAVIIFMFIGFYTDVSATDVNLTLIDELSANFRISVFNLIPLLVLIVFAVLKLPTLLTIFMGILAGVLVALFLQPQALAQIFNESSSIGSNLINLWKVAANGVAFHSDNTALNSLLSGGGMTKMLNTIFLVLAALSFGSAMEANGALNFLISRFLHFTNSARSVITTTIFTSFGINFVTGDQYMSIIMPGRMYAESYKRLNLKPTALSRSLEDGGTITSVLVPWNTCAVYISGVLGISTYEYLPYCFFNIINPFLAIFFAFIGFKIARYDTKKEKEQL